jgi:hypothetical protein
MIAGSLFIAVMRGLERTSTVPWAASAQKPAVVPGFDGQRQAARRDRRNGWRGRQPAENQTPIDARREFLAELELDHPGLDLNLTRGPQHDGLEILLDLHEPFWRVGDSQQRRSAIETHTTAFREQASNTLGQISVQIGGICSADE